MTRPDADLIAALERADYHPLWDRYQRITPIAPTAKDSPKIWRWHDFEPFVERAAREVPIADVERRAIILAHPAFGGATVTTGNLIGAFTILNPGDHAVPHRHTVSAIRFATRADGAVTIVNGRRCAMRPGDLVLTPPMCWHGHVNEGTRRTTWFDAANIPLVNDLDAQQAERKPLRLEQIRPFARAAGRNRAVRQHDAERARSVARALRAEGVTSAHVVAVAQESVELVVDLLHREGPQIIRRDVGHEPPRKRAWETEPETHQQCPWNPPRTAS